MKVKVKLSLVAILVLFSFMLSAQPYMLELKSEFQKKLDKINDFMQVHQSKELKDPAILMPFVEKELLTVWSAKNTIRAMLGPARWSILNEQQEKQLISAYEQTMRRYLYEVMNQYQGQVATVHGIRLNEKQNKGWLTVVLESPSLPDISIDLKIYKEGSNWTIYDFSFQGVSFIKMKQDYFQSLFDKLGFEGVLADLNSKNQEFNEKLKVALK